MSQDIVKAMQDLGATVSFGGGGGGGGGGGWDQPLAGSNLRPSEIGQCVGTGAIAAAVYGATTSVTGPGAVVAGAAAFGITTMGCIATASMN